MTLRKANCNIKTKILDVLLRKKIDGGMNRARSPPTDAADLSRGCNLNKGDIQYRVNKVKNNL